MRSITLWLMLVGLVLFVGCGEKDDDENDGEPDASTDTDVDSDADTDTDTDSDTDTDTDLDGGPDGSTSEPVWTYLKAPNNSNSDSFGAAVAMSGNTIAVGAYGEGSDTNQIINGADLSSTNDNESMTGAVYVYTWDETTDWTHQAYLKAPNAAASATPAQNQDYYGYAVAMDGDTIVVGAYSEASDTTATINDDDLSSTNDNGSDCGAVYVFRRTGDQWHHEAYLKAPNGYDNHRFGMAVDIDGDTIVVGVPRDDSSTTAIINGSDLSSTNQLGYSNGAVYVFVRNGSTWSFQSYLKAPNGANFDSFGDSVAISGDTIVASATGENSQTTAIIGGADLSATDDLGNDNGAAYVFTRSGTAWAMEAYLKAPNNTNGDEFGTVVDIDGDTIVVGAMEEDSDTTAVINGSDLSATNDMGHVNGAAYVFTRSGTTWSHQAYLKSPRTSIYDAFGQKLTINGDVIAVSAPGEGSSTNQVIYGSDLSAADDSGSSNGAVYLFERTGNTWGFTAYVKSPNNSNYDKLGWGVAVNDSRLVMGAVTEGSSTTQILYDGDIATSCDDNGSNNGAVYSFVY